MTTTEVIHKVQLVDGEFTATEANDVIGSLIDVKVNFHKLHRLSMCEGNIDSDTTFDNGRISELLNEKEEFKTVYQHAKQQGKNVRINGILEVEILD